MTRSEAIAANIAHRIARNRTRKRFSSLYADAIEETKHMSSKSPSPTTTSMNVADSPAVREPLQTSADPNAASAGQKSNASGAAGSGVTSGMGAEQNSQVRPISVKPVDRKTLTGSYPGDSRAQAAPAVLPANPGPREQMHGQQNSKFYNENGSAFQSSGDDSDSDAGN